MIIATGFSFAGCSEKTFVEEETEDMIVIHMPIWSPFQEVPGYIELKHTEAAKFECSVDYGGLYPSDSGEKRIVVKYDPSDVSIFKFDLAWLPPYGTGGRLASKRAFIYIILRVDKKITGYAVIVIDEVELETSHRFQTRLLRSALFPEVDGKPQKVKTKHVKKIMKKIKNEEVNK